MELIEFLLIVLPLGALIAILASVVIYLARKEDNKQNRELETLETLSEMVQSGILDRRNFASVLHGLLHDNIIDEDAYERLGKLLETQIQDQSET